MNDTQDIEISFLCGNCLKQFSRFMHLSLKYDFECAYDTTYEYKPVDR